MSFSPTEQLDAVDIFGTIRGGKTRCASLLVCIQKRKHACDFEEKKVEIYSQLASAYRGTFTLLLFIFLLPCDSYTEAYGSYLVSCVRPSVRFNHVQEACRDQRRVAYSNVGSPISSPTSNLASEAILASKKHFFEIIVTLRNVRDDVA